VSANGVLVKEEWCLGKGEKRLGKKECGPGKDDSDSWRVAMRAEIGTHFETALKTSLRGDFFGSFARISRKLCAAEVSRAPTRTPTRAPGPIAQKSHYKSQGYIKDFFSGFSLHPLSFILLYYCKFVAVFRLPPPPAGGGEGARSRWSRADSNRNFLQTRIWNFFRMIGFSIS
jgi:hypothetical protein